MTISAVGQQIFDSLGSVLAGAHGAPFAGAVGEMFQGVDQILDPSDGTPPFAILYDPDRCPFAWLPWLADQYGVQLVEGDTEANWRTTIRDRPPAKRGRPATHIAAIKATLTGTKHVDFNERDGSAYRLGVLTTPSETPDPAATLAASLSQKPAGIVLDEDAPATVTWADVIAEFDSWADVIAARPTWQDVLTTLP